MVPTYDEFCSGNSLGAIFEQNIKVFLDRELKRKTCHVSLISAPNVGSCWFAFLEFYEDYKALKIPIYICEENYRNDVGTLLLSSCDHCRGAGWGRHLVSRQSYHFMIPKDGVFAEPDDEEQNFVNALQKGFLMDVPSCCLYGLIHSNGYGHLISIQRSENCEFLSGIKIMQLWDRICTYLGTRKISLRDVAKKGPMDLRVLYAVALEHTWFGEWDYRFSRGSFGVTEARYKGALVSLKALTLEEITECCIHDDQRRKKVEKLIKVYRGRSTLKGNLRTIEDLFHHMLQGIRFFKSTKEKKKLAALAYSLYDGSMDINLQEDETSVAERIVGSLKRKRQSSVWTKRTDLLDEYRDNKKQADKVLKKLDGKRLGDLIIDKRTTGSVEYRVNDVGVPGSNVYSDMIYLYDHVFTKIPGHRSIKSDTQVLLDTVQCTKEFPNPAYEQRILICRVLIQVFGVDQYLEHGDVLVGVPPGSTFGDLKKEACNAIKQVYCSCGAASHITVEAIEGNGGLGDTAVVPEQLFGSEQTIGLVLNFECSPLCCSRNYQGGFRALTAVDCIQCGAEEDDGEEMVYCNTCSVLLHRRCSQLHDETVTACPRCPPADPDPADPDRSDPVPADLPSDHDPSDSDPE